jgi:hypothetical protein
VGDAVVEQQRTIRSPYLGALVADQRFAELEALDPLDGARVWPARTGRDEQPASTSRGQRGLVAGVDGQVQADDRPVEVEGQQAIAPSQATAGD